jgi:hypothetical protein
MVAENAKTGGLTCCFGVLGIDRVSKHEQFGCQDIHTDWTKKLVAENSKTGGLLCIA